MASHEGTILCINTWGKDGLNKEQVLDGLRDVLQGHLRSPPDVLLIQEFKFDKAELLYEALPGGKDVWHVCRTFDDVKAAPIVALNKGAAPVVPWRRRRRATCACSLKPAAQTCRSPDRLRRGVRGGGGATLPGAAPGL